MDILFIAAICFLQGMLVGAVTVMFLARTRYQPRVKLKVETNTATLLKDKVTRYQKQTEFSVVETPSSEFNYTLTVLQGVPNLFTVTEFLSLITVPSRVVLLLDTETSLNSGLGLSIHYEHIVANPLWVDTTRIVAPVPASVYFKEGLTLPEFKEALIAYCLR